jgi:hypothetical protein
VAASTTLQHGAGRYVVKAASRVQGAGVGGGMNRRDLLYIQREFQAWGWWQREGCTQPNAIGFKSSTVEYSIMRGETGGSCLAGSKVPERFNLDRNVERIQKIFTQLPEDQQIPISGVYLYLMPERRIALIVGVPRHQIRKRLYAGYAAGLEGLSTKQASMCL